MRLWATGAFLPLLRADLPTQEFWAIDSSLCPGWAGTRAFPRGSWKPYLVVRG